MTPALTALTGLALALGLTLTGPASHATTNEPPVGTGEAAASNGDMTVVDATVTPAADDLADGFATVRLELALRSTTPLPDELLAPMSFADPTTVYAQEVTGGSGPGWLPGETPRDLVPWEGLTRVSGTPTDGVWRADLLVSPARSGTWLVAGVRDFGGSSWDWVDVTGHSAVFELGTQAGPTIAIQPAPAAPVRVVTGDESWTPRARITERATGAVARGWWTTNEIDRTPSAQVTAGTLPRADAQGHVTLPTVPVVLQDGESTRYSVLAYASRGSRGLSWESTTTLWPQVKWQANQRYSVAGRTVTASGNAWPAPAVYTAANPSVHLQHLVGRTWRTVATAKVRGNGRYTLAWTAPTAGPQVLRVYKPGGTRGALTSVGSTLSAVTVTTR